MPADIERRSFEIIGEELKGRVFPEGQEPVVKRVIHTTADFDYVDSLRFSPGAVQRGVDALKRGAHIVTDTKMAWSGVNKTALEKLGSTAHCFMNDEDVAQAAKDNGGTRSAACMDKAATIAPAAIFAIGNAPTALIRIRELVEAGKLSPVLIIGAPVGFVNVVQSKELIMELPVPYIIARGRKGGSNVAAAICNALIYQATGLR